MGLQKVNTKIDAAINKIQDIFINVKEIPGVLYDGVNDDSAAIQAYLNNNVWGNLVLHFPMGTCLLSSININKSNVCIEGSGTLLNCTFNLNIQENDHNAYFVIKDVKMTCSSLQSGKHAFVSKMARYGKIKGVEFKNYDKVFYIEGYDGHHHVKRFQIIENVYENCNYFLYGERVENYENVFPIGDLKVASNEGHANITHIYCIGLDGLVCYGNTMFHTHGNTGVKKQNIRIDYCNFVLIYGNNLFEAGEESIYISHMQNCNVFGNNIAWPGQIIPTIAIRFAGGDNGNKNYCLSAIHGNNIDRSSGSGIGIEDNCGYITVHGNQIFDAGSSTYYYGDTDLSTYSHASVVVESTANKNSVYSNLAPRNTMFLNSNDIYTSGNAAGDGKAFKIKQTTINDGSTTLDMTCIDFAVLNNYVYTAIATIKGGYDGKEISLYAYSSNNAIESTGNIVVKEGTQINIPKGKTIHFKYLYNKWQEVGRNF